MTLDDRVRRSRRIKRLELAARLTRDPRKAKRLARLKREEWADVSRQVACAAKQLSEAFRKCGEAIALAAGRLPTPAVDLSAMLGPRCVSGQAL